MNNFTLFNLNDYVKDVVKEWGSFTLHYSSAYWWKDPHGRFSERNASCEQVTNKLNALGTVITPEDLDQIMGPAGWRPRCTCCGDIGDIVIKIDNALELSDFLLCRKCLKSMYETIFENY